MNEFIYAGKHLLTFSVAQHEHDTWEFIYCTSGEGVLDFADTSLPYREGDIALIPPHVPHSNRSLGGFTNIHVNVGNPTFSFQAPTLVRDDSNGFIRNAFQAAFFLYSESHQQQTSLLNAYGNVIVCHLAAHSSEQKLSTVTREIRSNIINNYPDCNYELDAYLHSLPFNYDYLRKLFKKEMGVTPHKFLMDIRLQTAAETLESDYGDASSISEVARMCGFREPLYFSRVFKTRFGVSPTAYQRHGAGGEEEA